MSVYYNEIDSFCCKWLRQLMKRGLIPEGEIDNRSIEDVKPDDVKGFTQCHWFAGISGWAYALRQAGWPDDRPIWSGSAPCQPWSSAGKRGGAKDERHLWPEFYRLIESCRPPIIVGEQVSSADVIGSVKKAGRKAKARDRPVWLDIVFDDLDRSGYACGACSTPAAGYGAPHIRQRLYWVAVAESFGLRGWRNGNAPRMRGEVQTAGRGSINGLADSASEQVDQESDRPAENERGRGANGVAGRGLVERLAYSAKRGCGSVDAGCKQSIHDARAYGVLDWLADSAGDRREREPERTETQAGQQGPGQGGELPGGFERCGGTGGLADAGHVGDSGRRTLGDANGAPYGTPETDGGEGVKREREEPDVIHVGSSDRVDNAQSEGVADQYEKRPVGGSAGGERLHGLGDSGPLFSGVALPASSRLERHTGYGGKKRGREKEVGPVAEANYEPYGAYPTNGFWANPDWLWCRDKKWRPVKSGVSPLVDGLSKELVSRRDCRAIRQRLKGYGNAIVIPQAVEFIKMVMEVL